MRLAWIASVAVAVVASANAGCFKTAQFTCGSDSECNRDGVAGTCEPLGFCSFPDPNCEDGRRYSEYSAGYSGQCVVDPVPVIIGGSVTGLVGSGLVLRNNGADDLEITADGAFAFPTPVFTGYPYAVVVGSQPSNPTQMCQVTGGVGTAGRVDITDVQITCTLASYTVGGMAIGVTGTGMVLTNNGGDPLPITADGPFTFSMPATSGTMYDVAIQTQPTAQMCNVSGETGTVGGGDVTSVVVNCVAGTYTIGGTISGLVGTVVLRNNGGNNLILNANGTFAFSTPVMTGNPYVVTVLTQPGYPPQSQTCTVTMGSGTVSGANVTNVVITCAVNRYTIGGSVSGVNGTLVLRNNGGDPETITTNTPYTFATPIASGSTYNVTVFTNPANQYCKVFNPSGTVTTSNITNANAACATMGISCDGAYCPVGTQQCCRSAVAPTGSMCTATGTPCAGQLKQMLCDDAYDCGGGSSICCARLNSGGDFLSAACAASTGQCTPSGQQTVAYLCNPVDTPPCPTGLTCVANPTYGWYSCQ